MFKFKVPKGNYKTGDITKTLVVNGSGRAHDLKSQKF